jgi:hypothetical protein
MWVARGGLGLQLPALSEMGETITYPTLQVVSKQRYWLVHTDVRCAVLVCPGAEAQLGAITHLHSISASQLSAALSGLDQHS